MENGLFRISAASHQLQHLEENSQPSFLAWSIYPVQTVLTGIDDTLAALRVYEEILKHFFNSIIRIKKE
jgi:hypothetical protein